MKVPVEIAKIIPSINLLDPDKISPSPIPKGVNRAKITMSQINVFFSVLALVNEIP